MGELTFNVSDMVVLLTVITLAGGVWHLYKEYNKPRKDLEETVERISRILDNDNKRLIMLEDTYKILAQSQLALIENRITNNNVDNLKKVRDDLQEYLINR